ncbi:carboxypeptidase-like regulatory domain-containing protein, partial [Phocaeicola dorei]
EEDGLPVVGASILVKGTTVGTVTDMDGKFTLSNVPSSAKTLVVSFIGMATQEVAVKANLNIVLKSDTEQLEEVMVVA